MRKLKLVLSLMVLGGALFAVRKPILTLAAQYLVDSEAPRKADLIIVLGGDASGFRAAKGCDLLREGYANEMWLSGAASFYGKSEGQLAMDFLRAQGRGCPEDKMKPLVNNVDSTRDEAIAIGRMMRERGVRRYLLVTSNFHTRRSGRVFRQVSPDLEAIVVSADDKEFPVDGWWEQRHNRKTFLYEWLKTISYWVGL